MTVKTILTEPNKLLRQVSLPVKKVGNEERQLMDDMLETMYAAKGIGLAAIQIGVPKRIIVMDISNRDKEKKPIELINRLIEEIGPCNLTQYCVTSLPYNREWNYEMPPFHIGTLDVEKLKFDCSKIPSDFYERYKDDLPSPKFTIQRNITITILQLLKQNLVISTNSIIFCYNCKH